MYKTIYKPLVGWLYYDGGALALNATLIWLRTCTTFFIRNPKGEGPFLDARNFSTYTVLSETYDTCVHTQRACNSKTSCPADGNKSAERPIFLSATRLSTIPYISNISASFFISLYRLLLEVVVVVVVLTTPAALYLLL